MQRVPTVEVSNSRLEAVGKVAGRCLTLLGSARGQGNTGAWGRERGLCRILMLQKRTKKTKESEREGENFKKITFPLVFSSESSLGFGALFGALG